MLGIGRLLRYWSFYGNGHCTQPGGWDVVWCLASGDRYDTDRCTAMAIVRNWVVGTWFTGTNSGGRDVVCCFASRDRYGTDPCTVMAVAPNQVIRTTVAVGRLKIGTVGTDRFTVLTVLRNGVVRT